VQDNFVQGEGSNKNILLLKVQVNFVQGYLLQTKISSS